ncbi:hypothetical protein JL991_16050, partial [Acinetobacter baumannii]|nr:hypothetical protein [Acinetobacter baumannii]
MVRKYFGPDGIRGKANEGAMTAETALRSGMAAGRVFRPGAHRPRPALGTDTRRSGHLPDPAPPAALPPRCMHVFLFGPPPPTSMQTNP